MLGCQIFVANFTCHEVRVRFKKIEKDHITLTKREVGTFEVFWSDVDCPIPLSTQKKVYGCALQTSPPLPLTLRAEPPYSPLLFSSLLGGESKEVLLTG